MIASVFDIKKKRPSIAEGTEFSFDDSKLPSGLVLSKSKRKKSGVCSNAKVKLITKLE